MKFVNKLSLIAFFLFIILLILALFNDWHYDEAWTFNGIKSSGIMDLVLYTKFQLANHQILNSLYFKLMQFFNVTHVIYYRLLSLLSFFIFFYANVNIFKSLGINKYFVIFMVIAPYMIYFTVGRGYGLSLAFFALSLMYLIKYRTEKKVLNGYLFVISGAISTLAIFSFIYAYAALLLIYVFFNREKLISYHLIIQSIIILITVLYVYYAGKIINAFDVDIIGSDGLFSRGGTLTSLISTFTYYIFDLTKYHLIAKMIFILCLSFPFLLVLIRKDSRQLFLNSSWPFILILLSALIFMVISNILFEAKYPLARAVMYLNYLILLLTVLTSKFYPKRVYYVPLILLLAFSSFNTLNIYTNLLKPSIKTIFKSTNGYPLFILNDNPSFKHTNSLNNLKKDSDINLSNDIQEINKWIKNTDDKCFLLISTDSINLNNYKKEDYKFCRDNFVLIELDKKSKDI